MPALHAPERLRTSPRLVLAVLSTAAGSFAMLQSLVTPVLPTIRADLHTSGSAVTWVITTWLLSAAVATPLLGRVAAGAVLGVGFGLAYSALTSLIVQSVPASQTGAASGMNTNIRTISGALGTAVVSSVLTAGARGGLPTGAGFTSAFWLLAAASLVAAAVSLRVPGARRAAVPSVADTDLALAR